MFFSLCFSDIIIPNLCIITLNSTTVYNLTAMPLVSIVYTTQLTCTSAVRYSTILITTKAVTTDTKKTKLVATTKKNILKAKLLRMGLISSLNTPLCPRCVSNKERLEAIVSSSPAPAPSSSVAALSAAACRNCLSVMLAMF